MKRLHQHKATLSVVVALLVSLSGIAYLAVPPGHVPPFDANRWRLAETYLEGYCAGSVFAITGNRNPNPEAAEMCRTENSHYENHIDMNRVIPGFCQAILATYGMPIEECAAAVAANQIWPLYDGGFSTSWNSAFPYPGTKLLQPPVEDQRGPDRDRMTREEPER